jgi:hypothetical protein
MKTGIVISRQDFASNYILNLGFPDVSLNEMEYENTIQLDYRDFWEVTKVENIDRREVLSMMPVMTNLFMF